MKQFLLFFALLCSLSVSAQKSRKVFVVIADGIPADVIERLRPANMMNIAAKGFYTRAYVGGHRDTYSETPTVSAPGYMDMLTGTWAYKHNVWGNDSLKPNRNYPTIFRAFKTAVPKGNTAIFSTWQDNRTVLIGAGIKETGNLRLDEVFDGYEKDSLHFPHDTSSLYLHSIDERVVQAADSVIRTKAPDLSWLYLEYTDDVGHSRGTGSAFDSAIGLLDLQMKKIADAIAFREKEKGEEWLLLITTDHGRDSVTGAEHGDQSARERNTWFICNRNQRNEYARTNIPAIVDIYPTVARFMGWKLPESVSQELDGVPMFGPVAIAGPSVRAEGDSLKITWNAYLPPATVRIYLSFTDQARYGKKDDYVLLGVTSSTKRSLSVVVKGLQNHTFIKVLLQSSANTVNIWHPAKNRSHRPE